MARPRARTSRRKRKDTAAAARPAAATSSPVAPPAPAQADPRKLVQLLALSFAALFLELMVIRWVPCVIRLVAYYANLLLISSFLGLGLGAMLSGRGWRLFRWFPLLVATYVAAVLLCRPVVMPGSLSEVRFYLLDIRAAGYGVLVLIFALNAAMFVPLGERIGTLFRELPPLWAYAWDLAGSLLGTLAFGLFSLRFFSPAAGFAVVMLVYLLSPHGWRTRAAAGVLFAALVAVAFSGERGARWSPYYYITVHADSSPNSPAVTEPPAGLRTMRDPPMYSVRVNQDFYQQHGTLDPARYASGSPRGAYAAELREVYTLPYALRPRPPGRVLIVGAGGGLDVEAALLSGAAHVDAAEIDRELVALSRLFSASGVYDDPRVTVRINDARAFLRAAAPGSFDVVAFGFLDSQALFSYSSNIRLDGYIYTVESIRRAYELLAPGGMLSISFVTPRPWLATKLQRMIAEATDRQPIIYAAGVQAVLCVPKGTSAAEEASLPLRIGRFVRSDVRPANVEPPTDDWPYLYLSQRAIPEDYLIVIGTLVVGSLLCVLILRPGQVGLADGHFFFLGGGFLLLETKAISDCALYFGATWLVTMLVIAGVLLMVIAANAVALRWRAYRPWFYLPLAAAVLLLYLVPRDTVLAWPLAVRLLWTLLAVPLPVFFAGLIFSTTFREARDPSALLGANLVGATVGGFAEYLSMATGLGALTLLVLATYAGSAACYTLCRRMRAA